MSDELNVPVAAPNFFDLPAEKPEETTEGYWVGTLPGCPLYNVTCGGVSFPKYTDPPTGTDMDSGQTSRAWAKGEIQYLTPTQVEAVRRSVKDKAVRFIGNRGQGFLFAIGNPRYTRQAGDQPLAMFLYMVPLTEQSILMRNVPRGGLPDSMYTMAGGKEKPVLPKKPTEPTPDLDPMIEDLDKPAHKQHTPPQLKGKGR